MADAIPVHSEPKQGKKRTVNVAASPELNPETGAITLGEYAAKPREGLGDPSDFNAGESAAIETPITIERVVEIDGKAQRVTEVHTHRAIRTDH